MGLFDLIGWLIVGAIAGWLASNFMGKGGYGLVGDIIVGIVGAFVGGWLAGTLFGVSMGGQSWLVTIPIAFIGAVIVVWVVRMVTRGRTTV